MPDDPFNLPTAAEYIKEEARYVGSAIKHATVDPVKHAAEELGHRVRHVASIKKLCEHVANNCMPWKRQKIVWSSTATCLWRTCLCPFSACVKLIRKWALLNSFQPCVNACHLPCCRDYTSMCSSRQIQLSQNGISHVVWSKLTVCKQHTSCHDLAKNFLPSKNAST